jgi:glycolate oxidase
MALRKDIYRELEDILGPENVSEDPVILDAYTFAGQHSQPLPGPEIKYRYYERPEAVVMPENTGEVQAIVRLCARRGLKSRAISTGYGFMNAALTEGIITIDLRRMNRILDIDEKNMFVVVEPYVSFAQVQAEAMKRGLTCNVIGAGSQPSFLASFTSVVGNNPQSVSQGFSGRNLLGVEWVLPTGEVVRLGSPGSGAGWFSGDGPGPSLRGIMRGVAGACGGLGVFTKCAGHLRPWPGPKDLNVKGVSPYYEAEVPPLFDYHVLEWPTWEQCGDAEYKIGEAGIAYALHKTGGPGSHGACITGNNNEYYEKRIAGELEIPRISWAIVTVAGTPGEHEYQVKTLYKILEETGGKISPVGEDSAWKKSDFIGMIRSCFIPRLAFRLTGNFSVDGMVGIETIDHAAMALKVDEGHRDKYAELGIIMDDGTLNSWGVPYEGAHMGLFEAGHQYDPTDETSCKGMVEMAREGEETALKIPQALNWTVMGPKLETLGPLCGNPKFWMGKIKKYFDPDTTSDPAFYTTAEQ